MYIHLCACLCFCKMTGPESIRDSLGRGGCGGAVNGAWSSESKALYPVTESGRLYCCYSAEKLDLDPDSMAAKSPADLSTSCSSPWKCCIDSHSRTGHLISLKFYTFPFPSFLSIASLKSHSFIG